jgi:hypothetical protein
VRTLTDDQRWLSKRLTIRYVLTAQAILAVSGLLGIILRSSQAGNGRLGNNTFYALMTAHGLGAFVGWAGFSVMGLAFWVFAEIGFPIRKLGHVMAEATYWLMTLGVLGIVVSTLFMHFAGSWVFLYPLPFHSAGQWGKLATVIFLSGVLLVGLAIVTWCLAILDTAISPALKAASKSWFNKLGLALGFGFLWPKRFATEDEPVPYPVIPLTVIAIDMIIATLPLAVLLVEMIVQTYVPSWHVDPLLAKNILWWFGHPVVYLLLFPAVAIYYVLVPRLAGRKLVSGNIITVGWTIAVVANVIVWAHHVYIDYPVNSPQAAIDTAMQPLTFSLTIVSALSLYSLFFTIYRSNYKWNAAGRALPRARLVALGRTVGRRQRDDRVRPGRPQLALDRRPLPPDGVPQHRVRGVRGDLHVAPRLDRPRALQRANGEAPHLLDVHLRHREQRRLAHRRPRGCAPPLRDPAGPLRGVLAGRYRLRDPHRARPDPLLLGRHSDDPRQGRKAGA